MSTSWTKESALAELQALVEETRSLAEQRRDSEGHVRWSLHTQRVLNAVFGPECDYLSSFKALKWYREGEFTVRSPIGGLWNREAAIEYEHQKAYINGLEQARGLLLAAKDHLESSDLEAVFKVEGRGSKASEIVKVINIAERKLRKVIREAPNNERDVQEAFETLLIGSDVNYSRESDVIEYSSKTYKPDFTVPDANLAVELKFCNRADREKAIIGEINDDILAYSTKYSSLLFVVYDLGFIRDIDRFIDSFETDGRVMVRVVKQ